MLARTCRNWALAIAVIAFSVSGSLASPDFEKLSDYAFVASRASSDIAVISVSDDQVVARLDLSKIPSQIVVSEGHRQLIATHADEQRVSIVDLDTGAVTKVIDPGFRPDILKLEDDLGMIALGRYGGDVITLISLDSMAIHASINGLEPVSDLMFGRDGKRLFIAQRDAGKVDVADVHRAAVVDQIVLAETDIGIRNLIRTPGGKTGLALHGENGLLSALSLDDGVQVGGSRLPGPSEASLRRTASIF